MIYISGETWLFIAFHVSLYPQMAATSLPTNHVVPSMIEYLRGIEIESLVWYSNVWVLVKVFIIKRSL